MPFMMIFALVVIALIVVGGIYGGHLLMASGTSSTTAQEVAEITANVQSLYSNQSSFATLTNQVAITDKAVPENMVQGTNIVNPYGGQVTLGPDATYNNAFDITEGGLDGGACSSLATGETAYGVEINGTQVAIGNQAVDPSTAAADCTQTGNGNSVTFIETQTNG
ncbi:MAG: type 4 pilus major pilin [Acidiferrobacterales bacterium]